MTNRKECLAVSRCQRRKKWKAAESFGGKCSLCGYNKCLAALEFHHVEGKKEAPSSIIHSWSWERAKKELQKCVLLCSNCHREVHYSERDMEYKINLMPWLRLDCKQCKTSFDTKNGNQLFCSIACRAVHDRRVLRPTKKQLEKMIQDRIPWIQLGKMFGVSDNGVRKWAKGYGIRIPTRRTN